MADFDTFETWWEIIKAGVGRDIDGVIIKFFTDDEQGRYGQGSPPAINFRFVDDTYGPAQSTRHGGAGNDPIYTCATRMGIHVWGKSTQQVHELRRRFIVALHAATGHRNHRLEGGAWDTGNAMTSGASYVFAVIWNIPIVRNAEGTAVITAFDNDVGIGEGP